MFTLLSMVNVNYNDYNSIYALENNYTTNYNVSNFKSTDFGESLSYTQNGAINALKNVISTTLINGLNTISNELDDGFIAIDNELNLFNN